MSYRPIAACAAIVVIMLAGTSAQGPVTGVFFNEGWESGSASNTFNSNVYGRATGGQFSVQTAVAAQGQYALRHALTAGTQPPAIQYATQHFGDAITGPVHVQGRGEHFPDLYVQYKIYYSPGFDRLSTNTYKQLIIGTQDAARHDNPCCNPWVAHYLTIYPPGDRNVAAEANNKQAASGQWVGFIENQNGYSGSNRYVIQNGRWYTVEVRRRLNDSGDNGIFQMWIDGLLISENRSVRYRVPFNGTYGTDFAYGTNFVMISDYTGATVPQDQSIYYDDVKLSPTYIGVGSTSTPPQAPSNVRIIQILASAFTGAPRLTDWR
jgi:hypothetical protein